MDTQEAARISAVKALGILDTEPEPVFDDAVTLAAAICGTPVGLVTFLDGERQWFKAKIGTDVCEVPQDQSFCVHAIRQPDLFVVPDALLDLRFCANPMVTSVPKIRFYAGMPLMDQGGHAIGTLCVLDVVPRNLTNEQQQAMILLSRQVATQVGLRSQMLGMSAELVQKTLFQEQITDTNALFQAFMDNSPLVGFVKDARGCLIYYNRLFAERFHIDRDEWIGKCEFDIWPTEFAAQSRNADLAVLADGRLVITEESSAETDIYWRTYKFPFVSGDGRCFLAAVSLDVSVEMKAGMELKASHEELRQVNQRLRALSITDALTGLLNRRGFDEQLHHEFKIALRRRSDFSMLMIDVDNFKSFNDTFGHGEGDEVLKQVGVQLLDGARTSDIVCRHGGEEFAILLPDTDLNAAVLLAQRICRSIASASWKHRKVTVSIGVATSTGGLPSPVALVRRADLALYEAKGQGKNRAVPYAMAMQTLLSAGD